MPNVPAPTMTDVQRADRAKLRKLLDEKAVLGYGFYYSKLYKLMQEYTSLEDPEIKEALHNCIASCDEPTEKQVMQELNEKISQIYAANNITSLRDMDPFGREVDCVYYDSSNTRLVEAKMIENAPSLGIPVKKLLDLIRLSKVTKEFSVLSLRGVQDRGEKVEGSKA